MAISKKANNNQADEGLGERNPYCWWEWKSVCRVPKELDD